MHTLNQHSMHIRLNSLEYVFEYAAFAATALFFRLRREYTSWALKGPVATLFDMPTPRHETRTVGQLTLSDPLGKGSEGSVCLASNSRNEVVAIKVIERKARTADRINAEIERYREVTDLVKDDDGKETVRLKEIIYLGGQERFSPGSAFDQVGLVIEPMAPATLDRVVGNADRG